jgi:uncharacterized metal-binding protein YceD (DUF177 family)
VTTRLDVENIGHSPRELLLRPDPSFRAALAERLRIQGVSELSCRFVIRREWAGGVLVRGTLDAVVVQDDVATLEPFAAPVHEDFVLRFLPEEKLRDVIDPDDPVDEVGYTGSLIDLEEAMSEQLALALDPYPRHPDDGNYGEA